MSATNIKKSNKMDISLLTFEAKIWFPLLPLPRVGFIAHCYKVGLRLLFTKRKFYHILVKEVYANQDINHRQQYWYAENAIIKHLYWKRPQQDPLASPQTNDHPFIPR